MIRYKKGSTSLELETISAKSVFDLCEKLGAGKHTGVDIYLIKTDDSRVSYRCNFSEKAAAIEVSKKTTAGYEYELKSNDWIWVEGTVYTYSSCATTFNGSPLLRIEDVYDELTKIFFVKK